MPSLQLTLFTGGLVTILYSLVPDGRWRGIGKWVVTGVVALPGYTSRRTLQPILEQRSDGRLHLDPAAPR